MPSRIDENQKPTVEADLNYRLDPTLGGTEVIWGGVYGQLRRKYHKIPVTITDERGYEDQFKLDEHGFQLEYAPGPGLELHNGAAPLRGTKYDNDCEALLKKVYVPTFDLPILTIA